jgi:hypothetical protein
MAVDLSVSYRAPATARRMAEAANRWLQSLSSSQQDVARFPFETGERYIWNYRPVMRQGLRLTNMDDQQAALARALFETGLSPRAVQKAHDIMILEADLLISEKLEHRGKTPDRNPEHYWFAVFGEPGGKEPWGWRAGGHHIGFHFTIVDGDCLAPTPLFLGANPAKVKHGPRTGYRTLPEEEDRARAFVQALPAEQQKIAVVRGHAPDDILSDAYRTVEMLGLPRGLDFAALSGEHRQQLLDLVRLYVERTHEEIARHEWDRLEKAGFETVNFAWAGPTEAGGRHYYVIQGPTFLIEYDNTQNGGNHIHSVWRDRQHDWGEDLLAQHYAHAHKPLYDAEGLGVGGR